MYLLNSINLARVKTINFNRRSLLFRKMDGNVTKYKQLVRHPAFPANNFFGGLGQMTSLNVQEGEAQPRYSLCPRFWARRGLVIVCRSLYVNNQALGIWFLCSHWLLNCWHEAVRLAGCFFVGWKILLRTQNRNPTQTFPVMRSPAVIAGKLFLGSIIHIVLSSIGVSNVNVNIMLYRKSGRKRWRVAWSGLLALGGVGLLQLWGALIQSRCSQWGFFDSYVIYATHLNAIFFNKIEMWPWISFYIHIVFFSIWNRIAARITKCFALGLVAGR